MPSDIIPPTYNGKPVTQLRYVAFRYADHIKTVMMPNTIKKIDWEAFSRCTSLENVYLPEGLKSLERLRFPDGIDKKASRISLLFQAESLRTQKIGRELVFSAEIRW